MKQCDGINESNHNEPEVIKFRIDSIIRKNGQVLFEIRFVRNIINGGEMYVIYGNAKLYNKVNGFHSAQNINQDKVK